MDKRTRRPQAVDVTGPDNTHVEDSFMGYPQQEYGKNGRLDTEIGMPHPKLPPSSAPPGSPAFQPRGPRIMFPNESYSTGSTVDLESIMSFATEPNHGTIQSMSSGRGAAPQDQRTKSVHEEIMSISGDDEGRLIHRALLEEMDSQEAPPTSPPPTAGRNLFLRSPKFLSLQPWENFEKTLNMFSFIDQAPWFGPKDTTSTSYDL